VAGDAFPEQIAAFCVSALASGTMFFRWWRMDGEGRRRVWRLYGWFSGLMLCGSMFGAVAWGANMQNLVLDFNTQNNPSSILTRAQIFSSAAQIRRWIAVFSVMYAMEFFCLSVAKLMVLDRMTDVPQADGLSRRWVVGGRVVLAAVVAGNVVGLGGNVAAAVCYERTAEFYSAASAAAAANNTADFKNFFSLAVQQEQLASSTQALQSFCEVAVLLVIIFAFTATSLQYNPAVVGVASARRASSALLDMTDDATVAAVNKLRLQIVGTSVFVFVTFLLRAVFSTWHALAFELQDGANRVSCPSKSPCDASCYNVYKLMQRWFIYTPEFQLTVVLISSPLALLVALWGMTSERTLQLMQSNRRQTNTMRDSMLRGKASGAE